MTHWSLSIVLSTTLATSIVFGQVVEESVDTLGQDHSFNTRIGLTFIKMLNRLGSFNGSRDDEVVSLVQAELSLNDTDAGDFVYLMATTRQAVNADLAGIEAEVACRSYVAWVEDDPHYPVVDEIMDRTSGVALRHLDLLNRNIGTELAARLQRWLERQASESTEGGTQVKQALRQRGMNQAAYIERICGGRKHD